MIQFDFTFWLNPIDYEIQSTPGTNFAPNQGMTFTRVDEFVQKVNITAMVCSQFIEPNSVI